METIKPIEPARKPSPLGRGQARPSGRARVREATDTPSQTQRPMACVKWTAKTAMPRDILAFCRQLRTDDTPPEELMWSVLRDRRFGGWKFRRQHAVGRFILAFYCHDAGLGIELDGGQHANPHDAAYDEARTARMERNGIRILRFWNSEVRSHFPQVMTTLWSELNKKC